MPVTRQLRARIVSEWKKSQHTIKALVADANTRDHCARTATILLSFASPATYSIRTNANRLHARDAADGSHTIQAGGLCKCQQHSQFIPHKVTWKNSSRMQMEGLWAVVADAERKAHSWSLLTELFFTRKSKERTECRSTSASGWSRRLTVQCFPLTTCVLSREEFRNVRIYIMYYTQFTLWHAKRTNNETERSSQIEIAVYQQWIIKGKLKKKTLSKHCASSKCQLNRKLITQLAIHILCPPNTAYCHTCCATKISWRD